MKKIIVIYAWDNGAFVSDQDHKFAERYKELREQYGYPTETYIRDEYVRMNSKGNIV